MAKLELPGISNLDVPSAPGITTGANAVLGALGAGRAQQQLGSSMVSEGAQLAAKAQASTDEALYQLNLGKANEELATRVTERMNKTTNEDGSPAFTTLTSDINSIYDEVSSKYGSTLFNPDVKSKFDAAMQDMRTRHTVSSINQARQQQDSFSRASLVEFTNSQHNAALADDYNNLPAYMDQIDSAIDAQVANGSITPEAASKMKIQQRGMLGQGKIGIVIAQDPNTAKALLEDPNKAKLFNLDELERQKYLAQADSAIAAQQKAIEEQQKKQDQLLSQQQSFNNSSMKVGIIDGQVTRADLDSALDQNKISISQYAERLTQLKERENQKKTTEDQITELGNAVANGEILGNRFSSKIVDAYYNQASQMIKRSDGKPATLVDKAKIVADINAAVPAFTSEIKGTVFNSKDPQKVIDAIKAYDIAANTNGLSISEIDAKTVDMMAVIATDLKYGLADPKKTIDKVREDFNKLTPSTEEEFRTLLKKENLYNPKNMDQLVDKVIPHKPWFSSNAEVSPVVRNTIRDMVGRAYLRQQNGDIDKAIAAVKMQVQASMGVTEVGGSKQVVFMPPEQNIVDPYTRKPLGVDKLNEMLDRDLKDALKDNNFAPKHEVTSITGKEMKDVITSYKDVTIGADQYTSKDNLSYVIYYKDQAGELVQLKDKNGAPARFVVTNKEFEDMHNNRVAEADKVNQNTIDNLNSASGLALGQNLYDTMKSFIAEKEAFSPNAHYDVNAFRAGYGSDTYTTEDGKVHKVTPSTQVTKEQAEADLKRRLPEFEATAKRVIGAQYDNLSDSAKVAVVSMTYNGALNKERGAAIAKAAANNDMNKVADIIESVKSDNPKYAAGLAARRKAEADFIRNHPDVPEQANANKLAELIRSTKPVEPFDLAKSLIGVGESMGTKALMDFFKENLGQSIDPRKIPWCAAFVNSVLHANGYSGTGSLAAKSFMNWGSSVANNPKKGDIVILNRTNDPNKGHVGFLVSIDKDTVTILGGNQDNKVSIKTYPKSKVAGIRRASPVSTAGTRG